MHWSEGKEGGGVGLRFGPVHSALHQTSRPAGGKCHKMPASWPLT